MTDEQILIEIQVRQKKIEHLQKLYDIPISSVQIWCNNRETVTIMVLDQAIFPFNLASEVKLLLLESILFYENEIQEFKNKF